MAGGVEAVEAATAVLRDCSANGPSTWTQPGQPVDRAWLPTGGVVRRAGASWLGFGRDTRIQSLIYRALTGLWRRGLVGKIAAGDRYSCLWSWWPSEGTCDTGEQAGPVDCDPGWCVRPGGGCWQCKIWAARNLGGPWPGEGAAGGR